MIMPEQPTVRTVAVGPFDIFFTNQNTAMGLRAHSHYGRVLVVYDTLGPHGYPSFEATNEALRARIHELTRQVFRNATNEDVADRIFAHLDGFVAAEWKEWGGHYELRAIHLDVVGVKDAIGHDASTTTYTVSR
jgi:hypothetical protein